MAVVPFSSRAQAIGLLRQAGTSLKRGEIALAAGVVGILLCLVLPMPRWLLDVSLDALPGKQLAIDADLSAGMCTETEARQRRKDLEDESTFFGAMDGASKFVRGDAVAGLMIVLINIFGGILIGTLQHGMSLFDATRTFTYLTVGEGLVGQIPALIVSTAAGL